MKTRENSPVSVNMKFERWSFSLRLLQVLFEFKVTNNLRDTGEVI